VFTLIQRYQETSSSRFKATRFKYLDDAVWAARESNVDYLIEEVACGVAPAKVVKYRIGNFEMG